MLTREELAKKIDHTVLKPFATESDVERVIEEAKKYGFRGVCVPPSYVKMAREKLEGTDILVVTVVGFPLGYSSTDVKVYEAVRAKADGADEVDMVINISAFKSGKYNLVEGDIRRVVEAVDPTPVKVIIETAYLSEDEIRKAAEIAVSAGAAFVKTNTGFGPRGVDVRDVEIIKEAVGGRAKIKASGGIRDARKALLLIKAGADVLGTSSGVKIIETFSEELAKEILGG